jgi:hypothetical protein
MHKPKNDDSSVSEDTFRASLFICFDHSDLQSVSDLQSLLDCNCEGQGVESTRPHPFWVTGKLPCSFEGDVKPESLAWESYAVDENIPLLGSKSD